jgi:hypothetical protein
MKAGLDLMSGGGKDKSHLERKEYVVRDGDLLRLRTDH